jgi:Peptidase A4 family
MGIWTVPTVSAPQGKYAAPAADDGQYHSASWVGLDGAWANNPNEPTASQDTLQAGIAQNVNPGITTQDQPGGIGLYYAWAEWFTPAFFNQNARTTYPYLAPQKISTVHVNPGDQIAVFVQYVQHRGDNISNPSPPPGPYHFGAVLLVNMTTGGTANFYWPPPPQASFAGDSAEWIMELNDGTVLPAFSTINFTDAEACDVADAPPGGVIGTELQDGTVIDLVDRLNFIERKPQGLEPK